MLQKPGVSEPWMYQNPGSTRTLDVPDSWMYPNPRCTRTLDVPELQMYQNPGGTRTLDVPEPKLQYRMYEYFCYHMFVDVSNKKYWFTLYVSKLTSLHIIISQTPVTLHFSGLLYYILPTFSFDSPSQLSTMIQTFELSLCECSVQVGFSSLYIVNIPFDAVFH